MEQRGAVLDLVNYTAVFSFGGNQLHWAKTLELLPAMEQGGAVLTSSTTVKRSILRESAAVGESAGTAGGHRTA